jgi:hypothetical protein
MKRYNQFFCKSDISREYIKQCSYLLILSFFFLNPLIFVFCNIVPEWLFWVELCMVLPVYALGGQLQNCGWINVLTAGGVYILIYVFVLLPVRMHITMRFVVWVLMEFFYFFWLILILIAFFIWGFSFPEQ